MTNVLVLGSRSGIEISKMGYPDIEPDYQGFKLRTRKRNYYDAVIDFHSLQTRPNRNTVDYLKSVADTMKVGGTINLFVPSLEWAADQIAFEEKPSPITLIHLFGNHQGPNQAHKSGHTLRSLRRDFVLAGFSVTHASGGMYSMSIVGPDGEPKELEALQHIVIGTKKEDKDNAIYEEIRK